MLYPLEHPQLQFRGVRHPVFVPRRVPDDVHVRVGDAGQLLQLVDDFDRKAWAAGQPGAVNVIRTPTALSASTAVS